MVWKVARKEEQPKISSSRRREGNWRRPKGNSLLESQSASHRGKKEKDKCLEKIQGDGRCRASEGTLEWFGDGKRVSGLQAV